MKNLTIKLVQDIVEAEKILGGMSKDSKMVDLYLDSLFCRRDSKWMSKMDCMLRKYISPVRTAREEKNFVDDTAAVLYLLSLRLYAMDEKDFDALMESYSKIVQFADGELNGFEDLEGIENKSERFKKPVSRVHELLEENRKLRRELEKLEIEKQANTRSLAKMFLNSRYGAPIPPFNYEEYPATCMCYNDYLRQILSHNDTGCCCKNKEENEK